MLELCNYQKIYKPFQDQEVPKHLLVILRQCANTAQLQSSRLPCHLKERKGRSV